jgi:hypothetical protein
MTHHQFTLPGLTPAPFNPTLPAPGSRAETLLHTLANSKTLTQPEWLAQGNGWRLAATVKELDYLGWQVRSTRVEVSGWPKPVAQYSLSGRARRLVAALRKAVH